LPETRFKKPFVLCGVKVGTVVNPATGAPLESEVGHATIETMQDLVEFETAVRLGQLVAIPSIATQAIGIAAEWCGQLENPVAGPAEEDEAKGGQDDGDERG
jgi:hypothetical protein